MGLKYVFAVSGKCRSGKDEFVKTALEYYEGNDKVNVYRVAFADPLKKIAKSIGWNGSKDGEGRQFLIDVGQILRGDIFFFDGEFQLLGSKFNCNRKTYDFKKIYDTLVHSYIPNKNFWVNLAIGNILETILEDDKQGKGSLFYISDARFKNEIECLKQYFSGKLQTIRIIRPGVKQVDDISEKDLDDYVFDKTIFNDSTLSHFRCSVVNLLKRYKI